jgi:16S rRNA U516 pseudouridylate synthase RsuA-like enzyme
VSKSAPSTAHLIFPRIVRFNLPFKDTKKKQIVARASVVYTFHLAAMVLAFHKPYGVLSQFTPDNSAHRTLAEFGFPPGQ